MSDHRFSAAEREALYRAIRERQDMRHFRPDPVDPEVLTRLVEAAHQAPSVGYMQPWRFIRITDTGLRESIHALTAAEQEATAAAVSERAAQVRRLKLEGIRECGELLVAARVEGLGLGWVSLFDPRALAQLLGLPEGALPIAVLCLGHVEAFYSEPMLQTAGWDRRRPLTGILFENRWGTPAGALSES